MKNLQDDLNFISKENFNIYNNDSHVLTQSEKGLSSLKNLLSNIKEENFSVINSKDLLKNKKLVLHLREKMFRGFIKTKILSERRKLKSAASESTDFNFNPKDTKMASINSTIGGMNNITKQKDFGFLIKNYKNFSQKQTNPIVKAINTKEKVFITDRENDVPNFLSNLIEYNVDTNIKESEGNSSHEEEKRIKRKIFKDSFEAKQYQRVNFIAFEINGPLSKQTKNLNVNKANIKRDIIKQIQSLDKIYSARSKDEIEKVNKIRVFDNSIRPGNRGEHEDESQQNLIEDKIFYKTFKETLMKEKLNHKPISAIKPTLYYKNINMALRKKDENSKKIRNYTADNRRRQDSITYNNAYNTNYTNHMVLNTKRNIKNKKFISGSSTTTKIRPKTDTKFTCPAIKENNDNIFSNILLRDSIDFNPRKVEYINHQKYKVNMNFIDLKSNHNNLSPSKERNYFDNQRILHVETKHTRLIENKMVQTDFKNLMTNRKEKFQKLKDSVFDFSKVPILNNNGLKSPSDINKIRIKINMKHKEGKNRGGDIRGIRPRL